MGTKGRNRQEQWNRARGVTLLELLVVVALVCVLLTLVFPSVGTGLAMLELRASAQKLAAAAKYARDQAVYQQKFFFLEIDAATGRVSVMGGAGETRRSFQLPETVRVETILPREEGPSRGRRRFLFSPDGGVEPFQVILGNGRRQVQVSADPLTGFPKVSDA